MSLDKDVAKFISDIPIPKISRRIYTTEEAMAIYRENYRDRIYEELRLKHVQKKIRNKILNRKNVDEDILFKKISIEQEINNTNISGLLSESEEGESLEMLNEGQSDEQDDKVYSEGQDDEEQDDKVYSEGQSDEEQDVFNDNDVYKNKQNITSKALKFLDLEAEQSGEESEAYEDDGSDISSIVDDQQEDENTAASLYADQKQKDDLEILKKLVGKFKQKNRKKSVKNFEQFEIDDSSSEGEIFSEMPFEEIEIPKEQIKLEFVKEEDFKEIKDGGVVFNKKKKYF